MRIDRLTGHSFAFVALALSAPRAAHAQTVGSPAPSEAATVSRSAADAQALDTVTLRDGTVLRGQIVERRADGSTIFMTVDRQVHTIAASDLAPPARTEPTAPALPPSEDDRRVIFTVDPIAGRVPIHIESLGPSLNAGTVSYTVVPGPLGSHETVEGGTPLCRTPCALYARPGVVTLWTGGPGRRSEQTALTVPQSGLRIRMRSASEGAFTIGLQLLVGGLLATTGGIVVGAIGIAQEPRQTLLAVGGVALGVGVIQLAIGIPLILANQSGVVLQEPLRPGTIAWSVDATLLNGGGLFSIGARF